ncbi:MAG: nucleotide exchange factor GrpE [Verrucomicrobia bacterium]|nr:nucleotide exchange factor GrpE [Verrucomicrobiota bacterium]
MSEQKTRALSKWPFIAGDLSLLALSGFIVYSSAWPLGLWQIGFCLAAVALGAWICILPFLREHQASVQMAEADVLAGAVAQLQNIEQVKTQIANTTAQWQFIQDESKQTVNAAKELAERMKSEVREFHAVLEKVNETEKAHLRLEVEKLRRAEGDWLQVVVRILDHIYALNHAAARSGQPGLISQLGQFQLACRDAARRVGLVPFAPARHDAFNPKMHQLADDKIQARPDAQITETLATGYSFQGHLIRKAVVSLRPETQPELPLTSSSAEDASQEPASPPEPQTATAEELAQPAEAVGS